MHVAARICALVIPAAAAAGVLGAKRRALGLVVLVALLGVLVGPAASTASASGGVSHVCCFALTIDLSGAVLAEYRQTEYPNIRGMYSYDWHGTTYAMGYLVGRSHTWVSEHGVASGEATEMYTVSQAPGAYVQPGCEPGFEAFHNAYLSGNKQRFIVERPGFPQFAPGADGENATFGFGNPFESRKWRERCNSFGTVESNVRLSNPELPGMFLGDGILGRGITRSKLVKRESVQQACVQRGSIPAAQTDGGAVTGYLYYKVYANVVYFPPKDRGSRQRRLKHFVGQPVRSDNPSNANPPDYNNFPHTGSPAGCS